VWNDARDRTQAEAIPDRVALKFETERVTYAAYNAEVNRLAWVLRRDGVTAPLHGVTARRRDA
jgi:non-ribosomal peptide synthetase component F